MVLDLAEFGRRLFIRPDLPADGFVRAIKREVVVCCCTFPLAHR